MVTLCRLFVVALALSAVRAAVPAGFVIQQVTHIDDATSISEVPTMAGGRQRLLATSKNGRIYMVTVTEDLTTDFGVPTVETTQIADFSGVVCSTGERGLLNALVHPDFEADKPYIYVFYTFRADTNCEENPFTGPGNVCSRLEYRNGQVDRSTERVLFRSPRLIRRVHNGGNMAFGSDGYLYVSVGDGGGRKEGVSQQLYNIEGTILRIDEDGGVPSDNPFAATGVRCHETGRAPTESDVCQEIFVYGLRNPFKISMDPNAEAVRFWIGDVGHNTWEEINECGTGYGGTNYGYPIKEGPCADALRDGYKNLEDCVPVEGLQEPEHWYFHNSKYAGSCVVGSAFSNRGLWPAEYDYVFFGDYNSDKIFMLKYDASAACNDCAIPVSSYTNITFHTNTPSIVDVQFFSFRNTQALYYIQRVQEFSLQRVVYVGGDNIAPVAILGTNVTSAVPLGSYIRFDASASSDVNGEALTFSWDFGDGRSGAGEIVTHQYNQEGSYVATLTVSDGMAIAQATETVSIGTPPTAEILVPAPGTEFAVGDVFVLQGKAVDATGFILPGSALTWEVRQVHADHYHPFLTPQSGNNIELLPAFEPEDFLAATNSFMQIHLTATDGNGLESKVVMDVMPKTHILNFESEPSEQVLIVDGYTVSTPVSVVSWENYRLEISAPDSELGRYVFTSWSNGGERTQTVLVGTDLTGTATAVFEDVCDSGPSWRQVGCQVTYFLFQILSWWLNTSISPGGFFGN